MKKNLKGRVALILAVLLVCLYGIFGIPNGVSGKALTDALTNHIHLGLDLRGGAHLIMRVEVKEAVSAETDNTVARLQQDLRKANIGFGRVTKPDPNDPGVVTVEGTPATSAQAVRTLFDQKYSNEFDASGSGNGDWKLTMRAPFRQDLEQRTVTRAIETIRERVDSLGVSEPVIQEYNLGAHQILVELPGVSDLNRVMEIIQSTARLEIHPVVGGPFPSEQAALQSVGGTLPGDDMVVPFSGNIGNRSGDQQYYVLQRIAVVAGTDFRRAIPQIDQNTGRQEVQFSLTNEAGDKFYEYTSKNVGNAMAVVMGGTVREVANIQSAIRDEGRITGSFTQQEVSDLSHLLETGALPASLTVYEQRTVGASLGADSIKEGVTAAVVGMLVVMLFMLVYYRGSGINADLALILNLIVLLGFLGWTSIMGNAATLTLPGIAGVILTIGMGVDSNVLIFERIREEIRAGKVAAAAVDQGFHHAWLTIVDTHVTTMVSALILFMFGTGPVRGFATTLFVGLLANLFTAVFVSRTIFDAHLNKVRPGEMVSI